MSPFQSFGSYFVRKKKICLGRFSSDLFQTAFNCFVSSWQRQPTSLRVFPQTLICSFIDYWRWNIPISCATLWLSLIRYLYFSIKNPAQGSFKSDTFYTDANCASCQSDKNQSGALAHIWQRLESILSRCGCHGSGRPDPSTSSGQRSLRSNGGPGQASRLNTLSGISGL